LKNNGKFIGINNQSINEALEKTSRQYLVGNLKLPQLIQHIDESDLEIGISYYKEENSYESAHWHPVQKEFQYVLSGRTVYTNVVTGEKYEYKEGDFYAIYPEICYDQVSDAGTKILFIKTPSVNDKVNWEE
jgi:quercetin dioxygenase-like cupin family protein